MKPDVGQPPEDREHFASPQRDHTGADASVTRRDVLKAGMGLAALSVLEACGGGHPLVPMPRLIAFLRAINVGGHTVTMATAARGVRGAGPEGRRDVHRQRQRHLHVARGRRRGAGEEDRSAPAQGARLRGRDVRPHRRRGRGGRALPAVPGGADRRRRDGLRRLRRDGRSTAADARAVMTFRTEFDDFRVKGREVYWLRKTRQTDSPFKYVSLEKTAEDPRHVPRHQHRGAAGGEARAIMITTRTLDAITILDLHGPLDAGPGGRRPAQGDPPRVRERRAHGDPQHGRTCRASTRPASPRWPPVT